MKGFEFSDSEPEEKGNRKRKTLCESKTPKPCLGFRFTELDIVRMILAGIRAKQFMRGYGQGARPRMIDRSRYL